MAKTSIKSRVSAIESQLHDEIDQAALGLSVWLDTQPRSDQEAFWRAITDKYSSVREPIPGSRGRLCGGLDLQPTDYKIAESMLDRAPRGLIRKVKRALQVPLKVIVQ